MLARMEVQLTGESQRGVSAALMPPAESVPFCVRTAVTSPETTRLQLRQYIESNLKHAKS